MRHTTVAEDALLWWHSLAAAQLSLATAQALAQSEWPQSKWALQMPSLSGQARGAARWQNSRGTRSAAAV